MAITALARSFRRWFLASSLNTHSIDLLVKVPPKSPVLQTSYGTESYPNSIEMVLPMDTRLRCPYCDSDSVALDQTRYEVPQFGPVLLEAATCKNCGYKHTDVTTVRTQEPLALTAKINSLEDLTMRVIKSGTSTINIPEFGATITSGPYSEGYISNVEGVLTKIEEALTIMLASADAKALQKGERVLRKIRAAKQVKPNFTFVIKDPQGNSALISPSVGKVKIRRLTRSEFLKLRFGDSAFVKGTSR
jgi:zinc finger protein